MGDVRARRVMTAAGVGVAVCLLVVVATTLWVTIGPGGAFATAAPTDSGSRGALPVSPASASTSTPTPEPTPSDTPTVRPPATPRDVSRTCGGREPLTDFADTERNVHAAMIDCISSYALTQGKGNGVYGVADPLTRGQVATFLVRTLEASGRTLPSGEAECSGIPHGESLDTLSAAGIMAADGCELGRRVNRSMMAQATAAALRWAGTEPTDVPDYFFDDGNRVARIQAAHDLLAHSGIVVGTTHGFFSPEQLLRRDQMATFLARLLDALAEG